MPTQTSTENAQATSPINITDTAERELLKLMNEKEVPEGYGLRIGVKGGGCSGFSYILGFDLQKPADNVYRIGEMTLYIDRAHGLYLAGMEIDYIDNLQNRGFIFNNPNATDTCGCGSSFSA